MSKYSNFVSAGIHNFSPALNEAELTSNLALQYRDNYSSYLRYASDSPVNNLALDYGQTDRFITRYNSTTGNMENVNLGSRYPVSNGKLHSSLQDPLETSVSEQPSVSSTSRNIPVPAENSMNEASEIAEDPLAESSSLPNFAAEEELLPADFAEEAIGTSVAEAVGGASIAMGPAMMIGQASMAMSNGINDYLTNSANEEAAQQYFINSHGISINAMTNANAIYQNSLHQNALVQSAGSIGSWASPLGMFIGRSFAASNYQPLTGDALDNVYSFSGKINPTDNQTIAQTTSASSSDNTSQDENVS